MEDVYDFYKPTMLSEYPRVDGQLSNACYLRALDGCYNRYAEKFEKHTGLPFSLHSADYSIFHAPYNKLVQKSFGRCLWNDYKRDPAANAHLAEFEQFNGLALDDTYTDRAFLKHLVAVSKEEYNRMVKPTELITMQCGNSYCGSTYAGLLSLISNKSGELEGKRSLMFSYGSGLAATQFSAKFADEAGVKKIAETTDVKSRLEARTKVTPEEFTSILAEREASYTLFDYTPSQPVSDVLPGTYYLTGVDSLERRSYARALHTSAAPVTAAIAPRMTVAPRSLATLGAPMLRLARGVLRK